MAHVQRGEKDFVEKKVEKEPEWKDKVKPNYMLYLHKHNETEKKRLDKIKEVNGW